ncbi:MIP/aquaporin family protein, partial [Microvirga sp. 0TCS3.31]
MSARPRPSRDRPLQGSPYPSARLHPDLYLAEFIGTAILILVGVSVVILMFGQGSPVPRIIPDEGLRLFLTGGLFGSVGALIAISPIGRISGAHINPAVTLAFWLEGKLVWRDASLYILAQFAGSAVGALPLLAWGYMGQSVAFGATRPGVGVPVWAAILGEAGVTFLLILAILTTAAHPNTRRFTPLVLPAVLSVLVWLEASISGASANPARSFGPALVASVSMNPWIYIVGPSLGAIL